VTFPSAARLRDMRQHQIVPLGRILFWVTLITGFLLLSIAAGLRVEAQDLFGSATRRQDFTASGTLRSLSVENLNGRVEIVAGPAFKAVVNVTARAKSDREAKQILGETACRFTNENGDLVLVVEPPGVSIRRSRRGGLEVRSRSGDPSRVEALIDVTLPSGVPVEVSTLNGGVSVKGIAADLKLSTVNGRIEVAGARHSLSLHTINGSVEAGVVELPKGAELELKSVSGNLSLTLPAAAGFRFEGRTLSGAIVSTFAIPVRAGTGEAARAEREKVLAEKAKVAAEKERVRDAARERALSGDLAELDRSLDEMSRELARMTGEIAREATLNLNRSYEGTVGGGGALVRMSNLSGRIALLAEGTTAAQAKPLVPARSARIVEIPDLAEIPPVPPVPPIPPIPPVPAVPPTPHLFGAPIVRGDVAGDFVATDVSGDVTLGQVAGKVKVATHWGEIRVGSAGKGAELSSAGGEIRVGSVTGDLVASTLGGDVRIGKVSGDARIETTGGDVVLRACGGAVKALTSGGDVTLRRVHGPVVARTSGGDVFCEIVSAEKPGVETATAGGDVTLVLPANYRGDVDVRVTGVDAEGDYVVSQFPGIAVVKTEGLQTAEGKIGGGGPKIVVRSAAGVVRIRKGPAAP
jgi:DUF4097 and DUF4098 domain-containing protein YvlB